MSISSIHSLRLQRVGCASYMRSSGAVPVSCFLLFALFFVFSSFFLLLFLVYFLYVVCECVPLVIFPVQRTTSGVGDRPSGVLASIDVSHDDID